VRAGELDLVVVGFAQVVFSEVKTRSSHAFGSPAASVTPAKQRRIRHLASLWLSAHPNVRGQVRFDVVAVMACDVEVGGVEVGGVEVVEAAF